MIQIQSPKPSSLIAACRREIGLLLGIFAVAAAVLLFLALADEVGEGGTHGFDMRILSVLHDPARHDLPIGPAWLTSAAADFTAFGSITDLALIVLVTSGLFVVQRRWLAAGGLLASGAAGIGLSQGLKLVFGRDRPPLAFHAVHAVNASFPSGHAMLSAIVYLTLGAIAARFAASRRMKIYALGCGVAMTLLVGCSRVFLGVHWATDVLAGWCLGAGWAIACWLVVSLWLRHGSRAAKQEAAATGMPAAPVSVSGGNADHHG
jgi:undecaprenyl-diphosphatase